MNRTCMHHIQAHTKGFCAFKMLQRDDKYLYNVEVIERYTQLVLLLNTALLWYREVVHNLILSSLHQ